SRAGGARLRVVVPPDVGDVAARSLAELDGVEVLRSDEVDGETPRTQVLHRPYQVFHHSDLPLLNRLGDRVVITQQDLISYRNPGYARSGLDWIDLHRLSRVTLAFADAVVFFSRHAAQDTLAEELAPADRAEVVYLGVDHRAFRPPARSARPAILPAELGADGYLLCLGTDFRHKNRVFALEVVAQLRVRHGWAGRLVFAGPHAAAGTSTEEERELLARGRDLAAHTVEAGQVSDEEKQWLVEHAAGVLYPSVYEGVGLIPFEAAEAGVPCVFAWQTALTET